ASPIDVLPEPLSPVSTSVFPRSRVSDTPLTAETMPSGVTNSARRSWTWRMGSFTDAFRWRSEGRAVLNYIRRAESLPGARSLQFAPDRDHFALNVNVCGVGVNRIHRVVGRLEPHAVAFGEELLQSGFVLAFEPGSDHIAGLGAVRC